MAGIYAVGLIVACLGLAFLTQLDNVYVRWGLGIILVTVALELLEKLRKLWKMHRLPAQVGRALDAHRPVEAPKIARIAEINRLIDEMGHPVYRPGHSKLRDFIDYKRQARYDYLGGGLLIDLRINEVDSELSALDRLDGHGRYFDSTEHRDPLWKALKRLLKEKWTLEREILRARRDIEAKIIKS